MKGMIIMNELEYVWLSRLEISNNQKINLIKKFKGIKNLYNSSLDDLVYFGVKDNIIYKILDKKRCLYRNYNSIKK